MDSPVCAEIAFAASRSGFPTFRFNYRGAGASEGPLSDRQACVEDAAAALDALERNVGHGELAVVGYDFGALVAMDLARSSFKIRQIAVVAPRTGDRVNEIDDALFAPPEAERFGLARLALVGELDPALVAIKRLSARNWEVETVASADHVFTSGLPELGRKLIAFLEAAG